MRNVDGLPVIGPVRTYRHEHAEWDRELGRFEYQSDDHGNWTERITSVRSDSLPGFERTGITRRTLTYYGEEPPV